MSDIVVAKTSFFAVLDGQEQMVSAGSAISSDHPLVAANPDNFKPLRVIRYEEKKSEPVEEEEETTPPAGEVEKDSSPRVEEATANPGQSRRVTPAPAPKKSPTTRR